MGFSEQIDDTDKKGALQGLLLSKNAQRGIH
jgi:hypothetical protein